VQAAIQKFTEVTAGSNLQPEENDGCRPREERSQLQCKVPNMESMVEKLSMQKTACMPCALDVDGEIMLPRTVTLWTWSATITKGHIVSAYPP